MELDLRKYIRLLLSWWWLLVVGAVVPTLISYRFLGERPNIYQAHVTLMVGTTMQSANPSVAEMGVEQRLARTYAAMVRYQPVTNAVIQQLGLERTPEELAEQVSTSVYPDANLLEILVTDGDPEAAAAIANVLAQVLIQQSPAGQSQGEQQRFVESQLSELRLKIEKVSRDIDEQTAQLANLSSAAEIRAAEENLASLENVLSRYRTEYALYLESFVGDSINRLTIVEPATVPDKPIGGKKMLILGIAAMGGIGLAAGGVILIDYLDDTLNWNKAPENKLHGWPILGGVGRLPVDVQSIQGFMSEQSLAATSLRSLRANILLARLRHPFQTLMITSPFSAEGKSTVAANLSAALAATGQRVVLVDGHMRKPMLHEILDLPNVSGLADLLSTTAQADAGDKAVKLYKTGVSNLWLLPAGQAPLDPTALLMTPRLSELVQHLRSMVDLVVVDAPAVTDMSAASVWAMQADAVILVVAHAVTTQAQVDWATDYVREHEEFKPLGVVFNRIRLRGRDFFYWAHRHGDAAIAPVRPAPDEEPAQDGATQEGAVVAPALDISGNGAEHLVRLDEAAETLGISMAAARRWVKTGRLSARRQGLHYWVCQADLDQVSGTGTVHLDGTTADQAATNGNCQSLSELFWSKGN